MIYKRLERGKLRYRKRYLGINSAIRLRLRRVKRIILKLLRIHSHVAIKAFANIGFEDEELFAGKLDRVNLLIRCCLQEYVKDKYVSPDEDKTSAPVKTDIRISDFEEKLDECEALFRFQGPDLRRLYNLLQFPLMCRLSNGSTMHGEEVFLLGLFRYAFPHRLEFDSTRIFGRENTQLCRAFKFFNSHIHDNFKTLLTDNEAFWVPYMASCAEAIKNKLAEHNLLFPDGTHFGIFAFIDNTLRKTCRPGGGPRTDRQRIDNLVQRAFYNGWKKIHALKWQTVDMPNDMTFHMWPAESGRRGDLFTLGESGINSRIRDCQPAGVQYAIYGDSIYPVMSHLRRRHQSIGGNTARQIEENEAMKKVRVSIEWNYGQTCNLFRYVDWRHNAKVLSGGSNISQCYLIATLLKNFHVCLYGCQTSDYFNCAPPTLETYFNSINILKKVHGNQAKVRIYSASSNFFFMNIQKMAASLWLKL